MKDNSLNILFIISTFIIIVCMMWIIRDLHGIAKQNAAELKMIIQYLKRLPS